MSHLFQAATPAPPSRHRRGGARAATITAGAALTRPPLRLATGTVMAIQVKPVARALGVLIEGIDLSQELPPPQVEELGGLLVEHQVLFFRNQPLTPQQQVRFAARFGTLHVHPIYPVLPELPEILVLDTHKDFLPDNDNWHTDVTFSETPPMAGILAAKQMPSSGGDTLWSSCSAAYEALSEPMRRFLDGLTAQ